MINWWKRFFNAASVQIQFYQLEDKIYRLEELFDILKTKNITMNTGNSIVRTILESFHERIVNLEHASEKEESSNEISQGRSAEGEAGDQGTGSAAISASIAEVCNGKADIGKEGITQ